MSIQKSGAVNPPADQGGVQVDDTITYSYVVTNTGNVTLDRVAVADPTDRARHLPNPRGARARVGDSITCTADNPYTVTQADVDAGHVTDTAIATGHGVRGGESPPSDPSSVTIPAEDVLSVSLQKLGQVTPFGDALEAKPGDTISYLYLVTNTGNVTLTTVAVNDPTLGPVTCPTPPPPGLAPLHTIVCTADTPHTVTPGDVAAGSVDDTAAAMGTAADGRTTPPAKDMSSIPTDPATPRVAIAKNGIVTPASHQFGAQVGDTIAYSYLVTNLGNVPLVSVAVDDPTLGPVTCPTLSTPLQPGDSVTCTADTPHTVTQADVNTGQVVDIATATGTDPGGRTSPPAVPSIVTTPTKKSSPAPPPPHHHGGNGGNGSGGGNGLGFIGTDLGQALPPETGARAVFLGLFALALALMSTGMISERRRRRL